VHNSGTCSRLGNLRPVKLALDILPAASKPKVNPLGFTVTLGGALLSTCAGMVNSIAFYGLSSFVSHVSGTWSRVGMRVTSGAYQDAAESAFLVLSFVVGSSICGCLISKNTVSLDRPLYGVVLLLNAAFLTFTVLISKSDAAPFVLAAACGLQNGMATSYSGAVIRTTHVTGIATDVGLIVGRVFVMVCQRLLECRCGRSRRRSMRRPFEELGKLRLLMILGISFLLGIVLGAILHARMAMSALFVPAACIGLAGTYYTAYRIFCPNLPLHRASSWLSPPASPCSPVSPHHSFVWGRATASRAKEEAARTSASTSASGESRGDEEEAGPASSTAAASSSSAPRSAAQASVHQAILESMVSLEVGISGLEGRLSSESAYSELRVAHETLKSMLQRVFRSETDPKRLQDDSVERADARCG